MTSDASGSWGCGAWCDMCWFQLEWDDRSKGFNVATEELIPIVIAAVIWGRGWQGCKIKAYCDNVAVVTILNSRYCQDKVLMQMLRCLFFIEAQFHFQISATHIPGSHSELADDLSRNRVASFKEKRKSANANPSLIPLSLLQWLLHPNLDWLSPSWMQLFSTSVHKE